MTLVGMPLFRASSRREMCVVAERASPPMRMPTLVSSALVRSSCEASS